MSGTHRRAVPAEEGAAIFFILCEKASKTCSGQQTQGLRWLCHGALPISLLIYSTG